MLTDEEIIEIRNRVRLNKHLHIDTIAFARSIERAVLAKATIAIYENANERGEPDVRKIQQAIFNAKGENSRYPLVEVEDFELLLDAYQNLIIDSASKAIPMPEGWQLVPIEVDRMQALSMVKSAAQACGMDTDIEPTEGEIENSFKFANAMLSASPKP